MHMLLGRACARAGGPATGPMRVRTLANTAGEGVPRMSVMSSSWCTTSLPVRDRDKGARKCFSLRLGRVQNP